MPERSAILERRALAYEPRFDLIAYRELQLVNPQDYQRLKEQLDARTRHNLETAIGERFNVELSQVAYSITDGKLKNSDHNEPFEEILRRGRDYRLKNGNPVDHAREDAEVLGFTRVQQLLTTNRGPLTAITISPRGSHNSDYQHNFFDVYQKDSNGQITMSRYTSKSTYMEFAQIIKKIDPRHPVPLYLDASFFLANPVCTNKNLAEILELFSQEEKTMTLEEYTELKEACTPLINAYLEKLAKSATEAEVDAAFRAIMKFSDIHTDNDLKPYNQQTKLKYYLLAHTPQLLPGLIRDLGSQPLRQVMAGCGVQSGSTAITSLFGSSFLNNSPFSVSEFGTSANAEDHKDFPCPRCGFIITFGAGIKSCPGCGLEATCV